jgi:succinate dehydrogenase/fumarate reductase flavoprotein subunit
VAETVRTDVLVVGSGGAAARAAIEAHREGAEVVMTTKGRFGAIGVRGGGATGISISEATGATGLGRVGRYGATAQVYDDVIQCGLGMTDRGLAKVLVDDTLDSARALDDWGVVFPGGEGMGGRQHGVPIMDVMTRVVHGSGVRLLERCMVTDLVVSNGECVGAVGVGEDGERYLFQCKVVILATGGTGQLFRFNMNPTCVTGDGYYMGYMAGADLMNMEFMQIFLGTVYPTVNIVHCWAWERGEKVTNAAGEEFIDRYIPPGGSLRQAQVEHAQHNPFTTRDTYSRYIDAAMVKEVVEGRGNEHGALYMHLSDHAAVPGGLTDWYRYRGIRWEDGPLQVGICHHCSNGGLVIDENAQSTLPRLYACGEQAAGPHGGDRLGGQMLAASQVFGARAGRHAAQAAKGTAPSFDHEAAQDAIAVIDTFAAGNGDQDPTALKARLQKTARSNLLVARTPDSLTRVLADIQEIRERLSHISARTPYDVVEALETRSLLTVGEMIASGAMMRTESRSSHYRVDFPEQDDEQWMKVIKIRRADAGMRLEPFLMDPDWQCRPGDMEGQGWG